MKKVYKSIAVLFVFIFIMTFMPNITGAADTARSDAAALICVAAKYAGKSGSTLGYKDDWCSYFVQKCASEAGLVAKGIFPKSNAVAPKSNTSIGYAVGLADWITNNNKGTYYYFERKSKYKDTRTISANRETFVPQPGDLIFFNFGNDNAIWHVGIVSRIAGSYICYIDGNSGYSEYGANRYTSEVKCNQSAYKTDRTIVGYLRPDYSKSTATVPTNIMAAFLRVPSAMVQGKGYHIEGRIGSTGEPIKSVTAYVLNSAGKPALPVQTVNYNTYFLNLYNSKLDNALLFSKLSNGTYKLYYQIKTATKTVNSKSITFTVNKNGTPKPIKPQPVSITFSNLNVPSKIMQIDGGHITGTVKSTGSPITSVTAYVKDSSNKIVMTATQKLSVYNFNLYNSTLDWNLKFGNLKTGNYTIFYNAKAGTKSVNSGTLKFTVVPKPAPKISYSGIKVTDFVKQRVGGHIYGTLTSVNAPINQITANVKNSAGKTVLTKTVNLSAYKYNLCDSALDKNLLLGNLAIGDYYMQITAKAGNKVITTSAFPFQVQSKNKRYILARGASTWQSAQNYAKSRGGHLATITTAAENDLVYAYMLSMGYRDAYIGLVKNGGKWVWVTGESVMYTNWAPGEPNNSNGKENMAMFYNKYTNRKWNDGSFNINSVFIYEID